MNAQTTDFIERMGLALESDGLPRIAGRIFGLLLVREDCRSLVVVGGLLFSQLITLYITPVVYTYLDAWQKRLARGKSRAPREYPEPGTGEARAAEAAG